MKYRLTFPDGQEAFMKIEKAGKNLVFQVNPQNTEQLSPQVDISGAAQYNGVDDANI